MVPISFWSMPVILINPLNAELNAICYLLALLGAHPILHVSRIRVNSCMKCLVCGFVAVTNELLVLGT